MILAVFCVRLACFPSFSTNTLVITRKKEVLPTPIRFDDLISDQVGFHSNNQSSHKKPLEIGSWCDSSLFAQKETLDAFTVCWSLRPFFGVLALFWCFKSVLVPWRFPGVLALFRCPDALSAPQSKISRPTRIHCDVCLLNRNVFSSYSSDAFSAEENGKIYN